MCFPYEREMEDLKRIMREKAYSAEIEKQILDRMDTDKKNDGLHPAEMKRGMEDMERWKAGKSLCGEVALHNGMAMLPFTGGCFVVLLRKEFAKS